MTEEKLKIANFLCETMESYENILQSINIVKEENTDLASVRFVFRNRQISLFNNELDLKPILTTAEEIVRTTYEKYKKKFDEL